MSDYTELKKLADAAGGGEWGYSGSYVCPVRREDGTTYVQSWKSVAVCYQPENTKFIAAANPAAILKLIAENERLVALDKMHVQQFNGLSEFRDRTVEAFDGKILQLEAEIEELHREIADCASSLPGVIYMDPPDGGDISVGDQLRRMAADAQRYRYLRTKGLSLEGHDFISFGDIADYRVDEIMQRGES